MDIIFGECLDRPTPTTSYSDYVHEQKQQLKAAFSLARKHMQKQAELRAYRFDLRVKSREYIPCQFAWFYYPRKRKGLKDKWASWYVGLVKIEKKLGPVLYQIRKSPRSQAQLVYADKLKPFLGELPRLWGGE